MPVNPKKINITARDLLDRRRVGTAVNRFALHLPTVKLHVYYDWLAQFIESRLSKAHLFVPDTCFLTVEHEMPPRFWDAILSNRVILTSRVFDELTDWKTTPFKNVSNAKLVSDLDRSHVGPGFMLDDVQFWDEDRLKARDYYTTLLTLRKEWAFELVDTFRNTYGRDPIESERNRLFQISAKSRDFELLRKGYEQGGGSNWWTDEDLVVTAAQIAFFGGHDTSVLTRDRDVFEQFHKLVTLLTIDYQAMLFAESFIKYKSQFKLAPMPFAVPELSAFFEVKDSVLVEKPVSAADFLEWLLPKEYDTVRLSCILLGGPPRELTVQIAIFEAERDMDRLMKTKGQALGRNFPFHDGTNCHVTGFPKGIERPRDFVIIGHDKVKQAKGTDLKWSRLDVAHARYHFEEIVSTA